MTGDKTLAQLAQEAIDVQNASNLRGVLSSWHKALCAVGHGSPEELMLNALYLSKVTSLLQADCDGVGGISIHANNHQPLIQHMEFETAYEWAMGVSK